MGVLAVSIGKSMIVVIFGNNTVNNIKNFPKYHEPPGGEWCV